MKNTSRLCTGAFDVLNREHCEVRWTTSKRDEMNLMTGKKQGDDTSYDSYVDGLPWDMYDKSQRVGFPILHRVHRSQCQCVVRCHYNVTTFESARELVTLR